MSHIAASGLISRVIDLRTFLKRYVRDPPKVWTYRIYPFSHDLASLLLQAKIASAF